MRPRRERDKDSDVNAFNLNGPSCIINTACSSSVYGIHNACHALRTGDCDAAIAAGSNLVMIVVRIRFPCPKIVEG